MPALSFPFTQFILLRLRWRGRFGAKRFAEATEQVRVHGVGLGQDARGTRVLPHPTRLDQADLNPTALERLNKAALIPSAGFTDHLHLSSDLTQVLDQRISSQNVVRHAP